MSNKKILIIHDRFQFRGGAERLILILAKALNADLMTEFWEKESFKKPSYFNSTRSPEASSPRDKSIKKNTTNKQQKNLYLLSKGEAPQIVWRYMRAHLSYFFRTYKITKKYDTIIFSGNNCLSASFPIRILELFKKISKLFPLLTKVKGCRWQVKRVRGGNKKRFILYCPSPVRHVFDLKQKCKSEQKNWLKKFIYYDIGSWGIRFIYWLGLKQMNFTIANSENIKKRLLNFSHHKTDRVIYPPIDNFKNDVTLSGAKDPVEINQSNFYLSFGRIERLKRIPDILSAFQKMPNKKLIVVSGGPDLAKIKNMAKDYDNIQIVGWVSDEDLKKYINNCIATIYIPIDEDFGMTPLESNSAGKPCIGVAEGGLLETIIDKKTGKLISANYTTQDLIDAVNWMTPERALSMREDCKQHAQKFSAERFIKEMKEVVFEE